jgi:peptidoglycan-associated lipoprotein
MTALMTSPALRTLALAVALSALAACESPSKITQPTPAAVETRSPVAPAAAANPGGAGATASATPAQSTVTSVDLSAARGMAVGPGGAGAGAAGSAALMAAPTQRVVYFDFDSFVIKDEFKGLLDAHAKVLVRDSGKRLVVEGHTDDRGGREYNLALGQKRAESVLRSLTLLGVSERQVEAVSFGEERPAAAGADEASWAKNRRAELKDR